MENLQNLFPEFEWNIEEVRQEKREAYKQLKESAPYLSLICQEEKRTVFAEGKNFWSRKYQTYSEMWWEVRENTEASLGEKQYNYLMTFVKFRNRQLKKNVTRKKDMEECIESILAAKDLMRLMKKTFSLYLPSIKKKLADELEGESEKMEKIINSIFRENVVSAATICLGLNVAKKAEGYYFCENRRNKLNENKINIISSGKVWHWSDYSNEIKEILSKSGLALMTLHMAEKMKNHEDYLRCIHPYNF